MHTTRCKGVRQRYRPGWPTGALPRNGEQTNGLHLQTLIIWLGSAIVNSEHPALAGRLDKELTL